MFSRFMIFSTLACASLFATSEKKDPQKVAEAFGHLIGKNLDALGVEFDLSHVVKGLQDSAKGKESPLSESECIEAISAAQETAFKKKSEANLAQAETFLKKNAKAKNIVVAEEGKLQYKIEQKGTGAKVQEHDNPVIRYVGKFEDGSVFGKSEKDETISLDETIKGFQKGIVGMQEGEKRTLFIHPELGYGTQGYLPPNSLLTFEIEVLKANAPTEE